MRILLMFLLAALAPLVLSQDLASFSVNPVPGAGITPVGVSLEGINYNTDKGRLALYEARGSREIPSQLERGTVTRLWFIYDNRAGRKTYVIRLVNDENQVSGALSANLDEDNLTFSQEGSPLFSYRHSIMSPPEGVEKIFGRSGFIHPLWSPGGEVLTRVQPPDHYHHYGIWNPWTAATFDGRTVDFWNLGSGQGTVRFAGFTGKEVGPVYAGMKALQEHVAFIDGEELIAMNELWDVRVWDINADDIRVVDITSVLNPALSGGILLNQFRYGGGLGFRTTERWNKDNSVVVTSEGLTRAEADGTNARWCIVEGESDVPAGRSGILLLSHPSNRMHPEPLRVWPLDMYGRGDLFFQFTPIRHEDWNLAPDTSYTQKYRMIVYDGGMSVEDAEKYWKSFAASPVVRFLQ